jgi:D-sedoheptulose 7-phosphate isomerase
VRGDRHVKDRDARSGAGGFARPRQTSFRPRRRGQRRQCQPRGHDFRKLCHIECYSPVDNVSELTARTNDEGWDTVFAGWLGISRLGAKDALLVYSVGGGDAERRISANLIRAIEFARQRGARVFGVVGKGTGYAAQKGDVVVVIPETAPQWIAPLAEAFQAVVWHCLVSHPALQLHKTTW